MQTNSNKLSTLTVHSVLSFLFGVSGFATIISIVLPLISVFTGSSIPLGFGLNAGLKIKNSAQISDTTAEFLFSNLRGDLTLINSSGFILIITSLIPVLIFGAVTSILYLLRKLCKNIYDGNYFCKENRQIMYIISAICILIPIVINLLKNVILSSLTAEPAGYYFEIIKPSFINSLFENFFSVYLLLGMLFILFANIFREGEKIKKEIDLTI